MTEENEFFRIGASAAFLIVLSIGGCAAVTNGQDNKAMVEMVSKGADPIAARCAVKSASDQICAIASARK